MNKVRKVVFERDIKALVYDKTCAHGCQTVSILFEEETYHINLYGKSKNDRFGIFGQTLLTIASGLNDSALIRSLVDCGVKINGRNANKETPLIVASRKGNKEAVITLLELGAKIKCRCFSGSETALKCAIRNGHNDIADIIRKETKRRKRRQE
ncbi:ankyrin repeat domain-containing protein [Patescibacteria group bacterium]|nr:ankyrin repeat domain-containing protein [Patescibacteria group bacterium]